MDQESIIHLCRWHFFNSHWDDAVVSTIEFVSGNDTTYKEDGGIDFYTSSSGVSLAGVGRQKRLSIKPEGQLHVFASGVNPPLRIDRAHPSSGVAIFTHNTPNNLASTSGISIGIGKEHCQYIGILCYICLYWLPKSGPGT